jgi:hypothetical protein
MGRIPVVSSVLGVSLLLAPSAVSQFDAPTGTLFAAPQLYEASVIHNLTRGDMDNDGKTDFVVAARNDTIFLTDDGAGGLVAQFMGGDTGGALRGIELFDWNGDGNLDVGIAKFDAPPAVWLGDGTGLVTEIQELEGGSPIFRDVTSADMDGDGNVDALFAGQSPKAVRTFFGDGNGGTTGSLTTFLQAGGARLTTLDLDLDGDLDVLVATNQHIRPLINGGVGDLSLADLVDHPGAPRDIVVRDLDGDGRGEVALTTTNPGRVRIFDVIDQGTLDEVGNYGTGELPRRSLFGDLNGDGLFDLVVPVRLDHRVEVRFGLGDNQFEGTPTLLPTSAHPMGALLADQNDDGLIDLVLGHGANLGDAPDLTVLSGTGVGAFQSPVTAPTNGSVFALAVLDMDGDEHPDVVTAEDGPDGLALYRNHAQYGLQLQQYMDPAGEVRDVDLGDVTGDGHPDAVVAYFDNFGGVGVFEGDGAGTLAPPVRVPFEQFTRQVALSDLDLDGDLDVLAATHDRASIVALVHDPRADVALSIVSQDLLPFDPGVMVLGDLSGDGEDDVAVAGSFSGQSRVLVNREMLLSFDVLDILPPLQNTLALGLGDADDDGDLDIVAAQGAGDTAQLRLLANDGDLGFTASTQLVTPALPHDVHVDDLDEDGFQDLITTASNVVMVHHGLGGGLYEPPQMYSAGGDEDGANLFDAVPVDMDGDRHMDIVLGSNLDYVAILPNRLSPWWNVGGKASGGSVLRVRGPLEGGEQTDLLVEDGEPFDVAWIVTGLSPVLEPAGDGVLVPAQDDVFPLVLDENGCAEFPLHVSTGLPQGFPFWVQSWDLQRDESVLPSDALLGMFE